MKNFILFGTIEYYPSGGMRDCLGAFESTKEMLTFITEKGSREDYHAYDIKNDVVLDFDDYDNTWDKDKRIQL